MKEVIQDAWWNKTTMSFGDKFMLISGRYMALFFSLLCLYIISNQIIYKIILYLNDSGYFDGTKKFLIESFTMEEPKENLADISVLILLAIGFILYIIKRQQQLYYGLLETIFALANCQIASGIIKSSLLHNGNKFYVLLLTGMTTIYLLIRGISNVREGYDKPFFLKDRIRFLDIFLLDYDDIRKKYNIKIDE